MLSISAAAARRFLVRRQLLAPARALEGLDGVREVFRRLGSIQFDPLAVAGRNHDLVLHARVAGYRREWTDELLYERRELFEAYNKGLSLLPTSELPWYRLSSLVNAPRIIRENAELAEQILERIRSDGPLSTLDFEQGQKIDWFWAPTNAVRAILEALILTDVLGLARREGNRRYYDLAERLFPAELLERDEPVRERLRHKLLSRFRAHGLLGNAGTGEVWLGTGKAKPDPERPDLPSRTELREELVAAGEIVPVEVESLRGPRYVLRDEVGLLDGSPVPPSVAFVAPLDPLVWDRALLPPLFRFDYLWEVYVPEVKRRWGYYVLPILFGDRLVGRIEPRTDGRILGLRWEDGFDPRRADGFVEAMREALRAYLAFTGARRLQWAPHLAREKRLFLSRP